METERHPLPDAQCASGSGWRSVRTESSRITYSGRDNIFEFPGPSGNRAVLGEEWSCSKRSETR